MSLKADMRQILKPYYWVNILLSLSYVFCKRTPVVCNFLFPASDCELDSRETEILFFLIIVVMLRTRKAGSVTMVNYLSSSFVYTKIANLILWFYADIRYGLPYCAIMILTALLLPEPTYTGPEHVTYFRGPQTLEDEVKRNKHITWLVAPPAVDFLRLTLVVVVAGQVVCLYAAWHPACVNFAPVFAELSAAYSLDNLKFGKIDVGRYPEAAARHRVQDGPTSRQLPTVLLLVDGAERLRRPAPDARGKLLKFLFSKDNVKAAFDLDGIYQDCKDKLAVAAKVKKTEKTE